MAGFEGRKWLQLEDWFFLVDGTVGAQLMGGVNKKKKHFKQESLFHDLPGYGSFGR
jgi:hypothetical protein